MIHSFLLIGQSNAAGRGFREEVEPLPNDNLLVLRNGLWRPMYVPVNPDRKTSGISLAESFAAKYAADKGVQVGIIPCADGGSPISLWAEGEVLFDHACYQCELASRSSTIAGVLWHQGESDCSDDLHPVYAEKLAAVMRAFREKLQLHDVPFLLGGLGDYLVNCERDPKYKNYHLINEKVKAFTEAEPMTGYVSAEGLTPNPDNLHFSAAALREFGERYYTEFLKLEDKNKVFIDKTPKKETLNDISLL